MPAFRNIKEKRNLKHSRDDFYVSRTNKIDLGIFSAELSLCLLHEEAKNSENMPIRVKQHSSKRK